MVVASLTGPLSGLLGRRFGTGYVVMVCGAMIGAGPILGSFANTAVQFAVAYILATGR